ncbi:MAG TPA: hypothetical protein VJ957_07865 [Longimicrobiales bacterium]|nr:hypothetical protein [Longimicrobiales bacterium]
MTDEERLAREVNRLYWGTDTSVADIADQLDISRRALYDAIETAPAHLLCPECGAALGYRNRTSRARGDAECEVCGAEVDADAAPAPDAGQAKPATPARPPLDPDALDAGRTLLIGGALLTGVAIGALVGLVGRRS